MTVSFLDNFGEPLLHDNLRDNIGQVISDKLAEMTDGGREVFDIYDSRNIDAISERRRLVNAILEAHGYKAE